MGGEDAAMLHRLWALTLAGVVVAGCETPPKLDLQLNENLYRPTGYKARQSTGLSVYVAPIVDARQPPKAAPGDAIGYLGDDDWDRAPGVMVQSVLVDELRTSGLFVAVLEEPTAGAIELIPTLKTFEGGLHEQPFGRRSLARVEIALAARSPEVEGTRSVLLEETFGAQQISNVDFRPPSPRVLLGTGLRSALGKGMAALDKAATAVAADPSKPAEASSTKR